MVKKMLVKTTWSYNDILQCNIGLKYQVILLCAWLFKNDDIALRCYMGKSQRATTFVLCCFLILETKGYIFFPGLFFMFFFSSFFSFMVVLGIGVCGWGLGLEFWGWGFKCMTNNTELTWPTMPQK